MIVPGWVPPVAHYMLVGLRATFLIAVISTIASLAVGVVLGALLTLRVGIVRLPIRAYVELWRGLPNVITLFFIFFTLPIININVSDVTAAIIGLSLWGSANVAEIVRGSIQSIPGGQFLGASALGFNWGQAMVYVILPQAVRRMIPPMMGLLTNLIQSTALASVIGVLDVLTAAQRSIQRLTVDTGHSHAAAILGAVMVIFFVICTPLTYVSRRFEARLAPATSTQQ